VTAKNEYTPERFSKLTSRYKNRNLFSEISETIWELGSNLTSSKYQRIYPRCGGVAIRVLGARNFARAIERYGDELTEVRILPDAGDNVLDASIITKSRNLQIFSLAFGAEIKDVESISRAGRLRSLIIQSPALGKVDVSKLRQLEEISIFYGKPDVDLCDSASIKFVALQNASVRILSGEIISPFVVSLSLYGAKNLKSIEPKGLENLENLEIVSANKLESLEGVSRLGLLQRLVVEKADRLINVDDVFNSKTINYVEFRDCPLLKCLNFPKVNYNIRKLFFTSKTRPSVTHEQLMHYFPNLEYYFVAS
jgi:Leucine-rich repeat (LRR) protein